MSRDTSPTSTTDTTPTSTATSAGVFEAVVNFRGLGGLETADGAVVRHGAVYRSAVLHHATESDRAILGLLGIRTVIDLRTHEERSAGGVVDGDWHGVDVHHIPLIVELWPAGASDADLDPVQYLVDRYEEMLEDPHGMLRPALELVADPAAHPIVFHCTAGKDRTGVLAALVLAVLGVADETIASDYQRSGSAMPALIELLAARSGSDADDEHSTAPLVAALTTAVAQPNGMLGAPREAMERVLARVRERHGSVESYLSGVGVPASLIHSLRLNLLVNT